MKRSGAFFLVVFSTVIIMCCSGNSANTKFQQYYVQGELLYLKHCSNCHQANGKGLGRIYPPLDTSDYMNEHFAEVICLIRNGKQGEIVVNGTQYVQAMPGIPTLTDIEIAEIATYVYNTWSHKRGLVDVSTVTTTLNACE